MYFECVIVGYAGDKVPSEIHVKKLVSEDTAANVEENPETESSEHSKNDGNEEQKGQNQGPKFSETDAKNEEIEEQSSPRGVLEIPISGSDSDNGSTIERSSSFGSEKSSGVSGELIYGNLHWKKLFNQIKKGSLKKFPTISLLGGHGYGLGFDLTRKKMMRKKIGRKNSEEDAIDCGDIVMPKPSWRNFSFEELKQATDNFSPGKLNYSLVFPIFLLSSVYVHTSSIFLLLAMIFLLLPVVIFGGSCSRSLFFCPIRMIHLS